MVNLKLNVNVKIKNKYIIMATHKNNITTQAIYDPVTKKYIRAGKQVRQIKIGNKAVVVKGKENNGFDIGVTSRRGQNNNTYFTDRMASYSTALKDKDYFTAEEKRRQSNPQGNRPEIMSINNKVGTPMYDLGRDKDGTQHYKSMNDLHELTVTTKRTTNVTKKINNTENTNTGLTRRQRFNQAFAAARKAGLDVFEFEGGKYGTQLAGETKKKTTNIPKSATELKKVNKEIDKGIRIEINRKTPFTTSKRTDQAGLYNINDPRYKNRF